MSKRGKLGCLGKDMSDNGRDAIFEMFGLGNEKDGMAEIAGFCKELEEMKSGKSSEARICRHVNPKQIGKNREK